MQREILQQTRALYPVSLHGVGLSLGSADPLDAVHLRTLSELVGAIEPLFVSEHLAWGSVDGRFMNDLLPLPYTEEALRHTASRVRAVQDALGRELLIENVSSYLEFNASQMTEWEFLAALAAESGCALLLDLNNLYVNSQNHGFDPRHYLSCMPAARVREMHLAGHGVKCIGARQVLIDTHATSVCAAVWELYAAALEHLGPVPTLIEWDADLPSLDVLVAEACKIEQMQRLHRAVAA